MNKLQNYLNDYVQKLDGDWSYLICNLKNSQETICLNGNHLHKSASMIKVLILATLCASDLDFNEKISIDYVPYVEGGGALQEMDSDTKVSIKALASLMIVLSDNLATNILIKIIRTINVHQSGMLYQFGIQSGIRTLKPNQLPVLFLSKQVTFRPENLRQINSYLKFTTRHQKQFKPLPSYPQCRFTGQHHICFVAKTSILGHRNGLTENIKE